MGLLWVRVMNQHPLQSCSLLLALPGHARMHVHAPAARLPTSSASVGSHSCTPSHANLFNNAPNPSNRQLFTTVSQQNPSLLAELLSLLLLSMSPPTPPPLPPSAVCTAAVGWKMAWKGGLAQGCQQRHNRYTHSPSDTHCALFLALLCYFSSLLSFCLFYR